MEGILGGGGGWIEAPLGLLVGGYAAGLFWFTRGIFAQRPPCGDPPGLSVVVAARNEAERVPGLLEDLARQELPARQWEVILVDDASTDGTAARCRELWRGASPLRVLSAAGSGKKEALAQGIGVARGPVVLCTDADCRVPPGWAAGMAGCFEPGVEMVVGFSQIAAPGQTRGGREGLEALDFLLLMGAALGSASQGVALAASGQNLAFRRAAFSAVGGYAQVAHRASGDDVLLLQLLRRRAPEGIRFCTAPGTFVVHPPSDSWRALLTQRARWASNAPYQLLLNPGFFAYITLVFGANLSLAAAPLLWHLGAARPGSLLALWALKAIAEAGLCWRATGFFGRRELRRYFPLWSALQPFYLVLAGVLGTLGVFTWKERQHRWGRRRLKP